MAGSMEGIERKIAIIVSAVYVMFEVVAFIALAAAVVLSVYGFFKSLVTEGFNYTLALEKVLLILIFIDLMRTITGSLTEGRFRMDVLLEAITIAIARDLIGVLALIKEQFNPLKLAVLTGMLAVTALLWWMARRVERREPGPRLLLSSPEEAEAAEREG